MNVLEVIKQFPNQEACISYLEQKRWNGKPICPYCQSENTNKTYNKETERYRHYCNGCCKSFSATIGTIFHDSRLPLQKWFLAIALILNAKKGISSRQMARDLDLPVKTAWSINHRIRKAMKQDDGLLSGIVEMDETYIGGKPRKEAKKKDNNDDFTNGGSGGNPRGRATKKECVVGMIERGGKVKAKNVEKRNLKAKDLKELVRAGVDVSSATLITDEYRGYMTMRRIINHLQINHSEAYANGVIHTNTIESFWAILKRGIVGQFHKVSKKYLNTYIDEFCWRFNNRKNENIFDDLVGNMLKL